MNIDLSNLSENSYENKSSINIINTQQILEMNLQVSCTVQFAQYFGY
jgi:hypothetical protein